MRPSSTVASIRKRALVHFVAPSKRPAELIIRNAADDPVAREIPVAALLRAAGGS